MFKKLVTLFKSNVDIDEQVSQTPEVASGLLGFAIGKRIAFDSSEMMWLSDEMLVNDCPEDLLIEAHSISIIGNSHNIDRFYASAEVYIQVHYLGRPCDANIKDIAYYSYDFASVCNTSEEIAEKQALMVAPTFEYRGETFTRTFDSETADETALIEFNEDVTNSACEVYSVYNHYMMFERELSNGTKELLQVSLEEASGFVSYSIALGKSIRSTDLTVSLTAVHSLKEIAC